MPTSVVYNADLRCYPRRHEIGCWRQFMVQHCATLPVSKPDVEEICDLKALPAITECRILKTPLGNKLLIQGVIKIKIIYVARVASQSMHAAHFSLPFCTFISLNFETDPSYSWHASSCRSVVEFVKACLLGYRKLSICCLLMVWFPKCQPEKDGYGDWEECVLDQEICTIFDGGDAGESAGEDDAGMVEPQCRGTDSFCRENGWQDKHDHHQLGYQDDLRCQQGRTTWNEKPRARLTGAVPGFSSFPPWWEKDEEW